MENSEEDVGAVRGALTALGVKGARALSCSQDVLAIAVRCADSAEFLSPSRLSSAQWACERLGTVGTDSWIMGLDTTIQAKRLPFSVSVGMLQDVGKMQDVLKEVPFSSTISCRRGVEGRLYRRGRRAGWQRIEYEGLRIRGKSWLQFLSPRQWGRSGMHSMRPRNFDRTAVF